MKHICKNCRWFKSNVIGDKSGECRRHAPHPANLNLTELNDESDGGFYAVWPKIHEELHCGEFEAK